MTKAFAEVGDRVFVARLGMIGTISWIAMPEPYKDEFDTYRPSFEDIEIYVNLDGEDNIVESLCCPSELFLLQEEL